MKKQRLEILKLVLEIFERDENYRHGICYSIQLLVIQGIDYNEIKLFESWFERQKPHSRFYSKFSKHLTFIGGGYWWVRTEQGYNQRVLFLKHLIEKLSK